MLNVLIYTLCAHAAANFLMGVYAKVKAALVAAAPAVGNALPADPNAALTSVEALVGKLLGQAFVWFKGLFAKKA